MGFIFFPSSKAEKIIFSNKIALCKWEKGIKKKKKGREKMSLYFFTRLVIACENMGKLFSI